ncbi:MAG: cyclodeaminase/cyclohydrolase family protein [Thermodesulfobacteriota bacterium]
MKLDELSVREFIEKLGSSQPTPGGGSIAALCGVLGAALSSMVAGITRKKERFRDRWACMEKLASSSEQLKEQLLSLVQQDTDAYQKVVSALKLSRQTEQERIARRKAMQASLQQAAAVPLETLRASETLMELAQQAAAQGDPITVTDAGAAVYLAYAAGAIASYNIRINLSQIQDEEFRLQVADELEERFIRLKALFAEMERYLDSHVK